MYIYIYTFIFMQYVYIYISYWTHVIVCHKINLFVYLDIMTTKAVSQVNRMIAPIGGMHI